MKKVLLGVAVLALLALASGTITILYILDWVGHIGILELFSIFLIVESIAVFLVADLVSKPRSMTVNFHTGPLSDEVKDIIKNSSYSDADLISFGNYLLSDLRDSRITQEHNKKCVGHWDTENWKSHNEGGSYPVADDRQQNSASADKPKSGKGAGKGHAKGKPVSAETRAKISASLKKMNAEKRKKSGK